MSPSRRQFFQLATAGVPFLSGCNAFDGATPTQPPDTNSPSQAPTSTPTISPTESPTESPTSTPPSPSGEDFEFLADIVRQPSTESPGMYRASLTNHSQSGYFLTGTEPLPIGKVVAENVDTDELLILLPDKRDSINQYNWGNGEEANIEDAKADGCWIAPDSLVRTAAGGRIRFPRRATVATDFRILAGPEGEDCATPGTYRVTDTARIRGIERYGYLGKFHFSVEVHVHSGNTLKISGSMDFEQL